MVCSNHQTMEQQNSAALNLLYLAENDSLNLKNTDSTDSVLRGASFNLNNCSLNHLNLSPDNIVADSHTETSSNNYSKRNYTILQSDLNFLFTSLTQEDDKQFSLVLDTKEFSEPKKTTNCDQLRLRELPEVKTLPKSDTIDILLSSSRQSDCNYPLKYDIEKTFINAKYDSTCPLLKSSKTNPEELCLGATDNDESHIVFNTLLSMSSLLFDDADISPSTYDESFNSTARLQLEKLVKPSEFLLDSSKSTSRALAAKQVEQDHVITNRTNFLNITPNIISFSTPETANLDKNESTQAATSSTKESINPTMESTRSSTESFYEEVKAFKPSPKAARSTLTGEEIASIPLDKNNNKTSIGSIDHALGTCRPCAFNKNKKKEQCLNGIFCLFCHFEHPKKFKKRRTQTKKNKQKQKQQQQEAQIQSQLQAQLHAELQAQFQTQLQSQLQSQLQAQLQSQMQAQMQAQMQLQTRLQSQLKNQLQAQLHTQAQSHLCRVSEPQLQHIITQNHKQIDHHPPYSNLSKPGQKHYFQEDSLPRNFNKTQFNQIAQSLGKYAQKNKKKTGQRIYREYEDPNSQIFKHSSPQIQQLLTKSLHSANQNQISNQNMLGNNMNEILEEYRTYPQYAVYNYGWPS